MRLLGDESTDTGKVDTPHRMDAGACRGKTDLTNQRKIRFNPSKSALSMF
ncbi:hypothetical protein [Candidatus Methylobacter oryzae]|nr:hypothetical protein [Candidatus Methylobacter oryzae]